MLLAGHMRELWDGGAAIVAAMSDDTVAGGGIRVTTPLDLWVHGLMGVEERIGTCTADAVLMELGATHYEREYGPGAHAAGLAAYAGSLYQSSRSTFRPLMRVSSGVRNLIAGGNGGGGGGDGGEGGDGGGGSDRGGGGGGDRGAGGAPGASPPPVPAQSGAAEASATATLAAGRRAAEAPGTALDTADALTGARRVPFEELVNPVDARAAEEMGQADIVNRAEDLPERTRAADTAAQLGALRETLRMDATESASEAAGGFRASEFEGAVSRHPATGRGGPPEIEPPSAVCGEKAPIARPHPGVAWGHGPEMKLGLLGGADRPPQPAAQKFDFLATNRRLRDLRIHYHRHSRANIAYNFKLAIFRVSRRIMHLFEKFGGNTDELAHRPSGFTLAEQAYCTLQKTARQVQRDGDRLWAGTIHEALDAIDKYAVETLQAVCPEHGMAEAPSTQAMQQPPATAGSSVTVVPMTVAPPVRLDIPVLEIRIVLAVDLAFPESAGGLVRTTDVPDPPPASGLPVPSLSDAGDLGRARLDQPATAAEQPTTTEASVTPSLGETSSFWLQPVDPVPAPGSVPVGSGLHHTGRDRATASRHHHREQHRARSRRCAPHRFVAGRRLRRRACPLRRPAPPGVRCVAAHRRCPIVLRARDRRRARRGPAPRTDHRWN